MILSSNQMYLWLCIVLFVWYGCVSLQACDFLTSEFFCCEHCSGRKSVCAD
ncbi:hypothetical protein O6H91_10G040200 [Diphasiastrum complanatum]|uniref:Uncharacterized protein n=1 Tax=Diphasiastrum complanatum TaxID=34168 RepID=A0ACC2CG94_DIPCM|nr:hypothetical protein O6H91_10G040200 [Diphasiastrum complanatum]